MVGDTTTVSHIHNEVNPNIEVWSDIGHAKKALRGHLITVGVKHKSLTKSVSDYLTKCFEYVLQQNKGDPQGISNGYKVIPKHAFGEHNSCGAWCQFNKKPETYQHKYLPYGKNLEGEELKAELVQVC